MNILYQIIKETLNLKQDYFLSDEMEASEVEGWDSLGWINIMNNVEQKYNIVFDLDDVADIKTIGQLIKIIEQKCK